MSPLLLFALMSLSEQQSAAASPKTAPGESIQEPSSPQLHIAEASPESNPDSESIRQDNGIDSGPEEAYAAELSMLLAQKDREIQSLRQTINSISKQYDDLREVAEQYKEEAAKWHYLFLSKDA